MNWHDDTPPPPMEGKTITTVIVVALVIWVLVALLNGAIRSDHLDIAEQVEQHQAE